MAWSSTTWTGAADVDSYQKHADDFWNALNERKQALGVAAGDVPIVGANIQSAQEAAPGAPDGTFSMRYIQDWIEDRCDDFVQSHELDGTIRAAGYYDNKATIDMWTFANLMKSVRGGTAAASFRRNAADWSVVGKAVLGDRFDQWICNDIQDALNRLIWTKKTSTFVKYTLTNNSNSGEELYSATWAAALAAAQADWDSEDNLAAVNGDVVFQYVLGECLAVGVYNATLASRMNFGSISTVPDFVKCDIDWYSFSEAFAGAAYDNNDTGLIEEMFAKWETTMGSQTATVYSPTALGDLDDYPDETVEPVPVESLQNGWLVDPGNSFAVLRWNMAGGFVYQ